MSPPARKNINRDKIPNLLEPEAWLATPKIKGPNIAANLLVIAINPKNSEDLEEGTMEA